MFLTDDIGGEVYSVGEVRFHKPVNRFFILLDDRQAEHLDDELKLDQTGNVTFLQLTPLQGG
jgi:hypothetical protein